MGAHAVITHALKQGEPCTWCEGEAVTMDGRDPVCQACANAPMITVGAGEAAELARIAARPAGVSLGKATDRYPTGSGLIMVPSEWELDRRRHHSVEVEFTRRSDGLEINCLDALRVFFAKAAGTLIVR